MIRFIITALFVILFLILSIPLLIAEWIIGKFNPPLKDRSSLAIVNWAFRMVLRLSGVSVTYIGEDRIPKDTPVLYVGNHRSYFDIVMTYVRVPRTTGYISKVEFLKIPLLSNWMKNLHCLFLDRSDLKAGMKTILAAIEEIKNGVSICIFPEGTRNRTDAPLLEFHAGSLKSSMPDRSDDDRQRRTDLRSPFSLHPQDKGYHRIWRTHRNKESRPHTAEGSDLPGCCTYF